MSTIEHPRVPAGVVDGGAPTPVQAILVPHTHWDREWYLTVEQLRPRLVRLFDNLRRIQADEPDHRGYWLDGQTCILEDYWESVGERPQWLADALLSRRILCGPWYTQVDEFLTAGESVVRNLLEGLPAGKPCGVPAGHVRARVADAIDSSGIRNRQRLLISWRR